MAPITRSFLDPTYETDIRVREVPLEREDGEVSRRLKCWLFENDAGEAICSLEVHRTAHLGELTEVELEAAYLLALRS